MNFALTHSPQNHRAPVRITRQTGQVQGALLSVITALIVVLGIALLPACSPDAASKPSGLHLQNAYLKLPVPGRRMTAAYATLINHEPQPLCLIGFEADFAGQIELHITEPVGDPNSQRVAMRHIPELCIESGASAVLKPGGMHLMVMDLDEAPAGHAVIRMGTRTGRLFSARFKIRPFTYTPEPDT